MRLMGSKMNRSLLLVILISIWYPVYGDNFDSSVISLAGEDAFKSKESHDSVSRNMVQSKYCRKPATCEKLKTTSCYGVKLPYTSTSLDYAPDVENQDDVQVGR